MFYKLLCLISFFSITIQVFASHEKTIEVFAPQNALIALCPVSPWVENSADLTNLDYEKIKFKNDFCTLGKSIDRLKTLKFVMKDKAVDNITLFVFFADNKIYKKIKLEMPIKEIHISEDWQSCVVAQEPYERDLPDTYRSMKLESPNLFD